MGDSVDELEQYSCRNCLLLHRMVIVTTKVIVFAGDFILYSNQKIEAMGGNPVLKKKSIAKVLQITEKYDLIDIWRVRNPSFTSFTFRKNHFSGFIHRRLYFLFPIQFKNLYKI